MASAGQAVQEAKPAHQSAPPKTGVQPDLGRQPEETGAKWPAKSMQLTDLKEVFPALRGSTPKPLSFLEICSSLVSRGRSETLFTLIAILQEGQSCECGYYVKGMRLQGWTTYLRLVAEFGIVTGHDWAQGEGLLWDPWEQSHWHAGGGPPSHALQQFPAPVSRRTSTVHRRLSVGPRASSCVPLSYAPRSCWRLTQISELGRLF